MKKFRYRFERILRIRQLQEEQAKQALGRELSLLQGLQRTLASLTAERDGVYAAMRDLQVSGMLDVPRLLAHRSQLAALQARLDAQREKVQAQQRIVEIHQEKVTEAMRARKTLDKLKENDREDWQKLFTAEENALLDEIGGRRQGG